MNTTEMSTQFQSAKRKIFSSSTFIADVISRSYQFLYATVPIHKAVGGNTGSYLWEVAKNCSVYSTLHLQIDVLNNSGKQATTLRSMM